MPINKDYWESLDVSIEDVIDDETRLNDIQKRLANKLEKVFGNCNDLIKQHYHVNGDNTYDIVSSLFTHNIENFRELYALAKYSENKVNSQYIQEIAEKYLKDTSQSVQQIRPQALLLPLFKVSPDALYDIHYSHILQSKIAKQYNLLKNLNIPVHFENINQDKIDLLLKEFEDKSKAKFKLQTKVWRYKPEKESALIVFRKEKKVRSKLSKVDKNEFHKTGIQKIISFKDGGNVLLVSSKDKRTVKIAEYIIHNLTNQRPKYALHLNQCKLSIFKKFIDDLTSRKIDNCSLISVKIENVALQNSSPTIELFCDEDAVPALNDLEKNHALSLLNKPEEFSSFRLNLNATTYSIKTIIENDTVIFLTDNRNVREDNKDEITKFFDTHLG